jgi:hypothetical protein
MFNLYQSIMWPGLIHTQSNLWPQYSYSVHLNLLFELESSLDTR